MSKDRACANTPALSRRSLLAGLPMATLTATSGMAKTSDVPGEIVQIERASLVALLHQLEAPNDYRRLATAAALAFAGRELRKAFDLPAPSDPELADLHETFEAERLAEHRRVSAFVKSFQLEVAA